MRILVVGAGATGGYFGGRLAAAGRDVSFLVREGRARALARDGLVIRSPHAGDLTLPGVKTVQAGDADRAGGFDLVFLSCKSYGLDDAIASFAPFVGPRTLILPVLNGMRHLDVLKARFGDANVLGGLCMIAATLDDQQHIVHLNDAQAVGFGDLAGGLTPRVQAIADTFSGAGFDVLPAENIVAKMWDKWVFPGHAGGGHLAVPRLGGRHPRRAGRPSAAGDALWPRPARSPRTTATRPARR